MAKNSATTPPPPGETPPTMTDSDFVDSLPVDLPANEATAPPAEPSISVTPKRVGNTRATASANGKAKKTVRAVHKKRAAPVRAVEAVEKKRAAPPKKSPHKSTAPIDNILIALAQELGLAHTLDLLRAQRQKVLSRLSR